MIYALVGKTCSGKSTAFQKLLELGYETTVSYTSRPKRPNETDGKEYIFISREEFRDLDRQGLIVAPREYNNWFYGMNAESIDETKNQVVIVDPKGFGDLISVLGNHVIGIYFDVPFEVRLLRGLNREDDINELLRRLQADEVDFEGIEEEIDYVVPSFYKQEALESIIKIIEGSSQK